MNIEELTVGQVKQIQNMTSGFTKGSQDGAWEVGKNYLIRTVTMMLSGKLKAIYPQELVLADAAWIADSGRFSEALVDQEKFNEVEPFKNDAIVGRGSIVDATEIVAIIRKLK